MRNPASDGGASGNGKGAFGHRHLTTLGLPPATPPGFDPARFPVLAAHFFGVVVYPRSNDVAVTHKEAA